MAQHRIEDLAYGEERPIHSSVAYRDDAMNPVRGIAHQDDDSLAAPSTEFSSGDGRYVRRTSQALRSFGSLDHSSEAERGDKRRGVRRADAGTLRQLLRQCSRKRLKRAELRKQRSCDVKRIFPLTTVTNDERDQLTF